MSKNRVAQVAKALGVRSDGEQFYTRAICHGDKDSSSLSVGMGSDGFPVLTCHSDAGCTYQVIRAALVEAGVPTKALRSGPGKASRRVHVYEDEHGDPHHRVKITKAPDGSKKVVQQRWERDGWRNGLKDTERVLYRLPELLRAKKRGDVVHLTEGEKDADALNEILRVHNLEEFATSSGAPGSWTERHANGYLHSLRGVEQIVIWADRDAHGYRDALARYELVVGAGIRATIRLPIPVVAKSDVSDHLAAGHKPADGVVITQAGLRELLGKQVDAEHELAVERHVAGLRVREEAQRRHQADLIADRVARSVKARHLTGAEFFMDLPEVSPVLWGDGKSVLWIDGEPLMIVGDDGTGKSTIDHQVIAARLGVFDTVLDFPVTPAPGTVVYLAMDRPEQARRAGHRLFPDDIGMEFRSQLDNLAVWTGPLPFDPLSAPERLADWLTSEFGNVSDVHVDSRKDLASNLSEDGVGSRLNQAIQETVTRGINWLGLHHQRKASGDNRTPDSLADVYGSRWLTAGHGSVLMLARSKGEQDYVELKQVKSPADQMPRLMLRHDRSRGVTRQVRGDLDLETALLMAEEGGSTINELVSRMYPNETANPALRKKIERQLKVKTDIGEVERSEGTKGGSGGSRASRYRLVDEVDA